MTPQQEWWKEHASYDYCHESCGENCCAGGGDYGEDDVKKILAEQRRKVIEEVKLITDVIKDDFIRKDFENSLNNLK